MKKYLFISVLLTGCPSSPVPTTDTGAGEVGFDSRGDTQFASLIESTEWQRVAFADDPFDPPTDASCDAERGMRANELSNEPTYEIETLLCGWGTATQVTQSAIKSGDPVNFRIWHFELVGDTEAVVKVRLGDWDIVDESIQQPADAQLLAGTIAAPKEFPVGTPVFFHVHNHGANEYSMIELSVGVP